MPVEFNSALGGANTGNASLSVARGGIFQKYRIDFGNQSQTTVNTNYTRHQFFVGKHLGSYVTRVANAASVQKTGLPE